MRPLTFLVGENSAGKTSFLAGLRFLLEVMSRESSNPFNRDPYHLGGFDQIAHYRGGRGGRPKTFDLSLTLTEPLANKRRRREIPTTEKLIEANQFPIIHRFGFAKGYPQPTLESYSFGSNSRELAINLAEQFPRATLTREPNRQVLEFTLENGPPSSLIKSNNSYLQFLLHDFTYRRGRVRGERAGTKRDQVAAELSSEDGNALFKMFANSRETMEQQVFSSAPVRSRPLRIYNPAELAATAEGLHVPLELARTKLQSPERWKSVKNSLIEFGSSSGLFTDIEVRKLGKGDVDPFQIVVKIGGPSMNIVDVGYGISQVLPIIYQVQNANPSTTFLLQQPEVHLHPRAQAELGTLFVKAVAAPRGHTFVVETHSDYIIDRVRIEVAAGRLSKDDVTIIFFSREAHGSTAKNLHVSETGEIIDTPDQFRTFFLEEQGRLLGL